MTRFTLLALVLFGSAHIVACGDEDTPPVMSPDPDPETEGFELEVEWRSCALFTEGSDMRAECADIEVPLHWSEPEGKRISLFLKRYRGEPGGGQSWVLTGGPGQSGSDVEPLVEQLIALEPTRTYYMIDHRGVGRSTRLRCENTEGPMSPNGIGIGEGEVQACLDDLLDEWSEDDLAGFSTLNASHDVGKLIEHLRDGDEGVSLMGGSYGTIWLEQYLTLYPEQANSVVFTAVAIDVDILSIDRYVDDMFSKWIDACDTDEQCGAHFEGAFAQSARAVMSETFRGEGVTFCPEIDALGITSEVLKTFFGQATMDLQGRSFCLPIAYRIARCAPEDITAITNLSRALAPPEGMQEVPLQIRNWGFALAENITVSELIRDRDEDEVRAEFSNAIAVNGSTPRLLESREIWPAYESQALPGSTYQGKLLMLHGEYDFLPEPVYRRIVDHYSSNNDNADFVLMPGAPHSVESPTTMGSQCGLSLVISRLLDPDAEVVDCASDVLPLVFEPPAATSMALFGTSDPWDGIPEATGEE